MTNKRYLRWNEMSAIIGYYRSGATIWDIYKLTDIPPETIETRINKYLKTRK